MADADAAQNGCTESRDVHDTPDTDAFHVPRDGTCREEKRIEYKPWIQSESESSSESVPPPSFAGRGRFASGAALLLGCGEDAEVVFPDDPAYVTESQIAFVSYRIVSYRIVS